MEKRIALNFHWNLSDYPNLSNEKLEELESEAFNRAFEMKKEGYVSGELHYDDGEIRVWGSWSFDNIPTEKEYEEITNSLCEAVADIAFLAGDYKYYSGDSREDIASFIQWGKEFEKRWRGVEWGNDFEKRWKDVEWGVDTKNDYIEEITLFAEEKFGDDNFL